MVSQEKENVWKPSKPLLGDQETERGRRVVRRTAYTPKIAIKKKNQQWDQEKGVRPRRSADIDKKFT